MNKSRRALEFLRTKPWAAQLVQLIEDEGGALRAPQGYLFEARFAFEMALACGDASIQYEYKAGVGDTSVDFCLNYEGTTWLIELVSLDETRTVQKLRAASRFEVVPGVTAERYCLVPDAENPRETPLAELIHVSERIEDKVWNKKRGEPSKFPEPTPGQQHLLLVNMARFEGTGDPDGDHCREIAFGSTRTKFWVSNLSTPIQGLFDVENRRPGAAEVSRRVHSLAFVAERPGCDDDDEIRRTLFILANPRFGSYRPRFPIAAPTAERNPLYSMQNGG